MSAATRRLAIVTGGSRGIGRAAARALAEAGADAILVGRHRADLERAAADLGAATGRTIHVAPFDLGEAAAIDGWYDRVCADIGVPDILVNAAGTTRRGAATELSLADWNEVIALNTTATWELSRRFAAKLIASGRPGHVVNIASLMTAAARRETSPYTASKGAIGQLTKALAIEWARHGILVNAIAPGYIATDLNKALKDDPAFDAWVKERCPLGRWGEAEDVAGPIAFLTSDAARFITGQTIYVDGGWLATF